MSSGTYTVYNYLIMKVKKSNRKKYIKNSKLWMSNACKNCLQEHNLNQFQTCPHWLKIQINYFYCIGNIQGHLPWCHSKGQH